jgi:probable LLM family oxidoreductase
VTVEIGVYTFAELRRDPRTGASVGTEQRLLDVLEEAELAEEVGLDVFGVGEHHRPDFAVSAPPVVLAAIAARTKRIRLTSAVTVLSSEEPIRVLQQFATVDLLSGGRAEVMVGRGSFIESFPLFGFDLADYDTLFETKLEELLRLREDGRTPDGHGVYPRSAHEPLPVWVAVGGTPESAYRAGRLGLPMALAIIGGQPERFVPFAELHRRAAREAGHDPPPALSINSHAYVADTAEQAADKYFPPYAAMMNAIGAERGWAPIERPTFDALRARRGALVVGGPDEVVEKILFQHELFGHERFLAQISVGTLSHANVLHAIELLGTKVAPRVREEVARRRTVAPTGALTGRLGQ